MKRKILLITMLLTMFSGGYALATTVNGTFEGNPIIKLFNGDKELTVSDVPAINYKNRTMVPIYLLNQMGIETKWDPKTYSVTLRLPETVKIVRPSLTSEQLNKIAESVVEVYGYESDPTKFEQGTGVVINNMLITNFHIGGNSPFIETKIADKLVRTTKTIFKNESSDLMAIEIYGINSLEYSTELPDVGDTVYAMGFPKHEFTITQGKVINLYEDEGRTVIQYDAKTNFGSSGGALLDAEGKVIGITTWILGDGSTSGAVPMKYVQEEIDKIK